MCCRHLAGRIKRNFCRQDAGSTGHAKIPFTTRASNTLVEAVTVVDELVVVETEAVEDGGVPVGDAHAVLYGGQCHTEDQRQGKPEYHPNGHFAILVRPSHSAILLYANSRKTPASRPTSSRVL